MTNPKARRIVLPAALLVLSVPLGFVLTIAALHTFWPVWGFIPYLDRGIAGLLTAAALTAVFLKAPPWAIAPLMGSAIGAWLTALIFRGHISV